MKNLLLSTAVVFATASFASAASHLMIANEVDNELATMSINVDVNALTEDQVNQLYQATQVEDTNERRAAIENVIRDSGMEMTEMDATPVAVSYPRNQLMLQVRNSAVDLGIENVSLRSLSDEQLTELYFLANGNEPEGDKKAMAKAILTN